MKTNEKKNTSAKKKLIPAVAMLTTSAVMLSTATYAWFTMSREVEVTGIKLTATTPQTIEVSLGKATAGANLAMMKNCGQTRQLQALYMQALVSLSLLHQRTEQISIIQQKLRRMVSLLI